MLKKLCLVSGRFGPLVSDSCKPHRSLTFAHKNQKGQKGAVLHTHTTHKHRPSMLLYQISLVPVDDAG